MSRIGAVVLAAGLARRFGGESKLLADLGGEPLIRHAVRAVCASNLTDVIIVTGREAEACRSAAQGFPVQFIHNPRWADGMGTSIACGVAALSPDLDGAFVVPGDMPFLTPVLLQELVRAFDEDGARHAVFPVLSDGGQRAPVLWPSRLFPQLLALSGDIGGKAILRDIGAETHSFLVADPLLLTDVDTAAEFASARAHLEGSRTPLGEDLGSGDPKAAGA